MDVRIARSFDALVREVRACFQDLANVADTLHAEDGVTASQRSVLEYLAENGPSTVPDIARVKHVSRQHIHQLSDALVAAELAQYLSNPAHKRSQLVKLTERGGATFMRMRQRELAAIAAGAHLVDADELDAAAQTLRRLRNALTQTGTAS